GDYWPLRAGDRVTRLGHVDESQEMLLQMVDKLRIQYRELPQFKQKEKVFASLYRKGFDLDDIASAWERSLTH
ncbi:MAG TPA: RecX family transcriptional regulator, partial [Candidatus Cloacimonadota bacterium]|nr:RecX family transcriptional regulator [Candidatus Cloacimonadota bacterium]